MDMGTTKWTGKDLFYDGVWCIADIGTPAYVKLQKQSQAAVAWGYQATYGHNFVYFCAVIIILFIIKRIIYIFTDNNSKIANSNSNFSKYWYYKIAAFNRWVSYRRIPSILCGIFQLPSSLGNFLLIMAGCLYMFCYTFIPKFWYRECRGFGSPPLAVRAGLEATSLVPFIIILSGKTNIISQLTDISYEKLNVYHRWVSAMCCFLGWVHTIPFYIQAYHEGGSARLSWFQDNESLFVNGIPPLVFLTVLTIFSHSYIRALWYELWLQIHWICAIGFYISLFIHCYPLLNSWKYLVATLVFWFTQLAWRAVNKAVLRPNKGFLRSNKCKMRRLTSNTDKDHFFEIVIENSNDFSWVPGQHLFIRIPGLRCVENHPFSIISYYEPRESTDIKLIVKAAGWNGLTSFLYKHLPDCDYSESNLFIDGPYGGCSRPVSAFDSVFLMASGTGITAILPFLHESCKQISNSNGVTKTVNFEWIIKSSENVEWILTELKTIMDTYTDLLRSKSVLIYIYVKEEIQFSDNSIMKELQTETTSSDSEGEKEDFKTKMSHNFINIINEKPNVKILISETVPKLDEKNIFIISGSDSMKIQASNSIANLQKEVLKSNSKVNEIYLHTESFGW
jgi:ferric-chelate reductase